MWNMTVYDVETALRAACDKVFRDKSVPSRARTSRAHGLLRLGEIMQLYGDSSKEGFDELKEQISG